MCVAFPERIFVLENRTKSTCRNFLTPVQKCPSLFSLVVSFRVNRQERLQQRNETAREVYLGPTARAWARARATVFSQAIVFRG